jgi:hypothetical protein
VIDKIRATDFLFLMNFHKIIKNIKGVKRYRKVQNSHATIRRQKLMIRLSLINAKIEQQVNEIENAKFIYPRLNV